MLPVCEQQMACKAKPWRRPDWMAICAILFILAGFVTWSIVGCGNPQPTTQPASSQPAGAVVARPAEPEPDLSGLPGRIHLVQANDTLYSLAERYYGHGKHYRKILVANRNRLTDPNNLTVGMKLIIP